MTNLFATPHHDPSERWLSNPFPEPGETIEVRLDVPEDDVDEAWLRTVRDGEGELIEGKRDERTNGATWTFQLPCSNQIVRYRFWLGSSSGSRWMTGTGLVDHDPTDHHDFRVSTSGGPPSWVPETVWYQIFPDRFASSGTERKLPAWAWASDWHDDVAVGPGAMTQMYGGDLDGIIDRLDHLIDLGVGGIYLTPIFPARSNHRYDASTFDHIDPLLGGDEALARLRTACDRAGLRLINDITLNHTGDGHDWFRTALDDREATEASFYSFAESPDCSSPLYETWCGVSSLPKLNHRSDALAERLYRGSDSVIGRFLQEPYRLDGWRVDVANMTGRSGWDDYNSSVRSATRKTVDALASEAWLLAEDFFDPSGDVTGPGWHGWMNYIGVSWPILLSLIHI